MHARTKRFIPLFWQAVFILLPVTVLAMVSLVSLRRDARRAELDAYNRATEDVQSLALAMRASVDDELQRFMTLQNEWTLGLKSAGQPSITIDFPNQKLKSNIEKWESDYPGLKFAELATPQAEISIDGRQMDPHQISTVPEPPKWFRYLSPEQQELWVQLRQAAHSNNRESIQKASEAFANSEPNQQAVQAGIRAMEPASNFVGDSGSIPTETGLSFQEIACYQLLSARNARLSGSLLQSVWWRVIDHPSFISARLLNLAEGLTNDADSVLRQKFLWTLQYWNEQSEVRAWMDQLREVPGVATPPDGSAGHGPRFEDLRTWKIGAPWATWANTPESAALALFDPCEFQNVDYETENGSFTGFGYQIRFVPKAVVEAVFSRALRENRIFISDYEAAVVTVEVKPVASALSQGISNFTTNSDTQLLGTAPQKAGTIGLPGAVAFSVNLYLTSREQMLSAERRRFRVFTMLILGAAVSALVGLIATWRAFYRQQELNEMKINFVSSVSHELRAPIASVRLMAENLERGKVPDAPRQNEYFRFIVQECRRLSSLIENVLDFSRIEQGRKQYEFEPSNLVAIIQTTVKLMEPYAAEKGVRLEIADAGSPNIELTVDGRAIQQALVNLIDNAIKHSPKGETVTTGIEPRNTSGNNADVPPAVLLFVADDGPGIPPEEHQKIFERFYRRGSELRRETQGVGIGLSVVQHIVEAHGGRVRVRSMPGQGSRFIIELPLKNQNE